MIKDLLVGSIMESDNFGRFMVMENHGYKRILIQFLDTGFSSEFRADQVREGRVKDKLAPSVCGVGFVGVGDYEVSVNRKVTPAYSHWRGMIKRCYDETTKERQPCYAGCTVCEEWHNFQNFAEWFYSQENSQEKNLHLDKDILIPGNKVYSPGACCLVSPQENAAKARAKRYKFVSPNGEVIEIENLRKFCIEHNLSDAHMNSVHSGKRNSHKGWTKV